MILNLNLQTLMNKLNRFYAATLVLALTFISCDNQHGDLADGLYAEIKTSKGDIIAELDYKKTPITVANFVTLAEGKNSFVQNEMKGKMFYDGLKFHRVIKDFMIQGGDPLGTGSGDAGYMFKDEITNLKHEKGVLSMANSGPATNSSQFFITHVATPWLNGLHTVFGRVVQGMEVVNNVQQGDFMNTVRIIRVGEDAKKFNPVKVFTDGYTAELEQSKKSKLVELENKRLYEDKYKAVIENKGLLFTESKAKAKTSLSGLKYFITDEGTGKKPAAASNIRINYAGYFENGEVFDTSIESVAKEFGKYDAQRAAQDGYSPIPFNTGNKRGMIPGFLEGISKINMGGSGIIYIPANLAYGAQGAGEVIPPNTNLIFEITIEKE